MNIGNDWQGKVGSMIGIYLQAIPSFFMIQDGRRTLTKYNTLPKLANNNGNEDINISLLIFNRNSNGEFLSQISDKNNYKIYFIGNF